MKTKSFEGELAMNSGYENIEVDLSDEQLLVLARLAHEKDITLNQLVANMLREHIESTEKRISFKEFEENFDSILEDVIQHNAVYIIEDSGVVIMPWIPMDH
jgi:hypothetical protein